MLYVPHFDNDPLADGPILMDDNDRTQRARIVREFRHQKTIDTFQMLAMFPDMNPIQYIWECFGRKENQ